MRKTDFIFMGNIHSLLRGDVQMVFSNVMVPAGKCFRSVIFRPCVKLSLRSKRPTTCDPNGHVAKKRLRTRLQVSCCSPIRENVKVSKHVNCTSHVCCYRTCHKRVKASDTQCQWRRGLLKKVTVADLVLKIRNSCVR